jgi:hypothetical protein
MERNSIKNLSAFRISLKNTILGSCSTYIIKLVLPIQRERSCLLITTMAVIYRDTVAKMNAM